MGCQDRDQQLWEAREHSSSDHKGSTDSSKQVTMSKHNVLLEHFGQDQQYM